MIILYDMLGFSLLLACSRLMGRLPDPLGRFTCQSTSSNTKSHAGVTDGTLAHKQLTSEDILAFVYRGISLVWRNMRATTLDTETQPESALPLIDACYQLPDRVCFCHARIMAICACSIYMYTSRSSLSNIEARDLSFT